MTSACHNVQWPDDCVCKFQAKRRGPPCLVPRIGPQGGSWTCKSAIWYHLINHLIIPVISDCFLPDRLGANPQPSKTLGTFTKEQGCIPAERWPLDGREACAERQHDFLKSVFWYYVTRCHRNIAAPRCLMFVLPELGPKGFSQFSHTALLPVTSYTSGPTTLRLPPLSQECTPPTCIAQLQFFVWFGWMQRPFHGRFVHYRWGIAFLHRTVRLDLFMQCLFEDGGAGRDKNWKEYCQIVSAGILAETEADTERALSSRTAGNTNLPDLEAWLW